jgi:hypothetical protein
MAAGPDESWGARGGNPGDAHAQASTSRAPPGPGPAGETEGASPDSLRNTPSNIARLQDTIGHCAARRKYLAHTKSPSDGKDVRWYFCKLPLADKGAPPPRPSPSPPLSSPVFDLGVSVSCDAWAVPGDQWPHVLTASEQLTHHGACRLLGV